MRKPIGEVLNGIEIAPLDDGDVALEALLLVKTVDDEGRVCWVERMTDGLHQLEWLGAVTAAKARLTRTSLENWIPDEGDDDAS